MSVPENERNDSKIVTVDNSEASGVSPRAKKHTNTAYLSLLESNNILPYDLPPSSHTGAVPKIRAKTAADNEASNSKTRSDLATPMDALRLTPCCSDENILRKEWIRARDSLEHVSSKEKPSEISSSKSTSYTGSKDNSIPESPYSESFIGNAKNTCSSSVSKVLAWDPWDKLGKKNKKENKRRKNEKLPETCSTACASKDKDTNRKDYKSGDEAIRQMAENQPQEAEGFEEYTYQPYQKTIRTVDFTNKVMVVFINKEDKVVGETSEPLKKEMEQQIRNKEMRRGHTPEATFTRRTSPEWYKTK